MKGEVISMSEFLVELDAISFIECGLNISAEEAGEIFETEVLGAALA